MTRLVFVRHGQPIDVENRCIGHTDVRLSPDGVPALRVLVANARRDSTLILSSDLRRAVESADVIAAALGCPVHQDARLREMNFGRWDGRSWAEIERDDPAAFQAWTERWTEVAPPGGESAADLARRAADWLAGTLRAETDGERIIVVSHSGWIRAALTQLLERDLARMFDIPVDYARATIVDVSESGCSVVASNALTVDG